MVTFPFIGGLLEIVVFLLALIGFMLAIRFFINSRKRLNEQFPGLTAPSRKGRRAAKSTGEAASPSVLPPRKNPLGNSKEAISELRRQLQQQEQDLTSTLHKITLAGRQMQDTMGKTPPLPGNQLALIELQTQIKVQGAEIQRLRQQEADAFKLQQQFAAVQDAFAEMQERLLQMEKQAWRAAELSIELEQAKEAEQTLETALRKKDEKLRDLYRENSHLRDTCHQLETKLSESQLQQQQLLRKVHLLEDLYTGLLQITRPSASRSGA